MLKSWIACCGIWMATITISAEAGYEEAIQANKNKDYTTATREFRSAAESGDKRAYFPLAVMLQRGIGTAQDQKEGFSWMKKAAEAGLPAAINGLAWDYLMGDGVEKDHKAALGWAMKTAELGNAEGQFAAYLAIQQGELSYLDTHGKADVAKYRYLSSRPVAERKSDILAYEMLFRSANQGYPQAVLLQASVFADNVGIENRRRFQELASKVSPEIPQLKNLVAGSKALDRLGNSLATVKIAMDAQVSAITAAGLSAGLIGKEKREACDIKQWKLTGMKVSSELAGAEYLPTAIPELAKTFLLKGHWQEEWTYDLCGRSVTLPLNFQADGFGGATFQIETRPAKNLGKTEARKSPNWRRPLRA